jgi:hypothetical protein
MVIYDMVMTITRYSKFDLGDLLPRDNAGNLFVLVIQNRIISLAYST